MFFFVVLCFSFRENTGQKHVRRLLSSFVVKINEAAQTKVDMNKKGILSFEVALICMLNSVALSAASLSLCFMRGVGSSPVCG